MKWTTHLLSWTTLVTVKIQLGNRRTLVTVMLQPCSRMTLVTVNTGCLNLQERSLCPPSFRQPLEAWLPVPYHHRHPTPAHNPVALRRSDPGAIRFIGKSSWHLTPARAVEVAGPDQHLHVDRLRRVPSPRLVGHAAVTPQFLQAVVTLLCPMLRRMTWRNERRLSSGTPAWILELYPSETTCLVVSKSLSSSIDSGDRMTPGNTNVTRPRHRPHQRTQRWALRSHTSREQAVVTLPLRLLLQHMGRLASPTCTAPTLQATCLVKGKRSPRRLPLFHSCQYGDTQQLRQEPSRHQRRHRLLLRHLTRHLHGSVVTLHPRGDQ